MSDRTRLTITLNKSILSKIDNLIDGSKLRNRSHAIETLIAKGMSDRVNQALILAGGKGINMRPFTFEMPKGLFPVSGKPILEHIINLLKKHGIHEIILSIGHLGEKIIEYFESGEKFGVNITYLNEKESLGTGGAILSAKKKINTNPFLVVHGDILIDINLSDMIAFHGKSKGIGTIALSSVLDPSKYGEVMLHGTKITHFFEKPKKGKQKSQIINCGLYIFDKKIFSYFPKIKKFQLEDILPKIVKNDVIAGFPFEGKFLDIGTPLMYEKAIKEWKIVEKI